MTEGNLDEQWMRAAIDEAKLAEGKGEVPVGAVIVHDGAIIGRGHNLRELSQDPTTHAEMIAIREAARALGSWRLIDTTLYVTLEPCPMCAGALVNARVPRVVWGCNDPKAGATETLYTIGSDPRLNHRFECVPGVLGDECSGLLTGFFTAIRSKNGPPKRR
jgi:tRNA(adenine34) deaminase